MFQQGDVPMWDEVTQAFVPSGMFFEQTDDDPRDPDAVYYRCPASSTNISKRLNYGGNSLYCEVNKVTIEGVVHRPSIPHFASNVVPTVWFERLGADSNACVGFKIAGKGDGVQAPYEGAVGFPRPFQFRAAYEPTVGYKGSALFDVCNNQSPAWADSASRGFWFRCGSSPVQAPGTGS